MRDLKQRSLLILLAIVSSSLMLAGQRGPAAGRYTAAQAAAGRNDRPETSAYGESSPHLNEAPYAARHVRSDGGVIALRTIRVGARARRYGSAPMEPHPALAGGLVSFARVAESRARPQTESRDRPVDRNRPLTSAEPA